MPTTGGKELESLGINTKLQSQSYLYQLVFSYKANVIYNIYDNL